MLKEIWFVLAPMGSTQGSDERMGLIEISPSLTVFHFQRAVLENNQAFLRGLDAISLQVCEHGSDSTLKGNKTLSDCTSGDSDRPFLVRYPGST